MECNGGRTIFIQLTLSERKGAKNSGFLYTVDIHSDSSIKIITEKSCKLDR